MKAPIITLLLIPIVLIALAGWSIFMVAFMLEKAVIAIAGTTPPGPIGASVNELTHKMKPNNGW